MASSDTGRGASDDRDEDGTPTRSLIVYLATVTSVVVILLYVLVECVPTIPL